MITTYGIALVNKSNKLLVAHPTRSPYNVWSIIKGCSDEDETKLETLNREFFEETSQSLSYICNDIIDISKLLKKTYKYNHNKKELYAFFGKLNENIDIAYFRCNSIVSNFKGLPDFPENDAYAWISYDDIGVLHLTQQKFIMDLYKNNFI